MQQLYHRFLQKERGVDIYVFECNLKKNEHPMTHQTTFVVLKSNEIFPLVCRQMKSQTVIEKTSIELVFQKESLPIVVFFNPEEPQYLFFSQEPADSMFYVNYRTCVGSFAQLLLRGFIQQVSITDTVIKESESHLS